MFRKIYASLTRRIILICLALIIIPMMVYTGLLWLKDWRIKARDVLDHLAIFSNTYSEAIGQWSRSNQSLLFVLEGLDASNEQLKVVAAEENVSSLFTFEKEDDRFTVIRSSIAKMVGVEDFFPEKLQKAYENKELLFSCINPFTKKKEVFLVSRSPSNNLVGMSINEHDWLGVLSRFSSKRYPFTLSVLKADEKKSEKLQVFSEEELQSKRGIWDLHQLKGDDLGIEIPISHADFTLLLDVSYPVIQKMEGETLFATFLVFLALIIIIGGGATIWLTARVSRPLGQFYNVIRTVGAGDLERRYRFDRMGFEINVLGEKFNKMVDQLLKTMEEAKNEKVSREILEKELSIGHQIQKELLPEKIPEFAGCTMGWGFIPAREVAGDYFDLIPRDQELIFSIADGSDKGISACLYSLMVRSMFRAQVFAEKDLEKMVVNTNNLFCIDTKDTGNFVTAWLGSYDAKTRELIYTSAGHLPAILITPDGKMEELSTEGIAFGVEPLQNAQVKKMVLRSGSTLFLYTDGLIEAHNKKDELYGKARLKDFLKSTHGRSAQELIDILLKDIETFSESKLPHDDLTILCLKTD